MKFYGTEQECREIIATLDTELGYPRGYTQADVDSGVVRRGAGVHVPIESVRTETIAAPAPVLVDDDGRPLTDERVVRLPPLRPEHRERVGRSRVLRVINRGSRERLLALPGIGEARADAIIARREQGRLVSIEDLRAALPAQVVQALRDYAATKVDDEDNDAAELAARVEAKKR